MTKHNKKVEENRLYRILSKLPNNRNNSNIEDIEERMNREWYKKASKKRLNIIIDLIDEKKRKSWKEILNKPAETFAFLGFQSKYFILADKKKRLIKMKTKQIPMKFKRNLNLVALSTALIVLSIITAKAIDNGNSSIFKLTDNILLYPTAKIYHVFSNSASLNEEKQRVSDQEIPDRQDLRRFIIENKEKIKTESKISDSISISIDEIMGQVAGAASEK